MKQSTSNATKGRKAAAASNSASKNQHRTGSRQATEKSSPRGNAGSSTGGRKTSASNKDSSHQGSFEGESHLEKFFLDQLQDIYYAEKKILQSLPKMQEAATTGELKDAFDDHLHQTQRHVRRLEKVFETLDKKAEAKKCEAIEGIAREVEQIIRETEEGTMTRDAALIIAAQKVEHYEIATYGGLVQLAITMQLHDAADLLDKTLVEEEDTDARLTEIAENEINLRAEHEGSQQGGEEGEEEDVDEESPTIRR
jgi:ferritin-like metal-binding protein YciE